MSEQGTRPGRRRWSWALAALAGVVAAPAPSPAAPPRLIEVENFRVGFSSNDRGNVFRLGSWTPVWVQLRAGAERFSGVLEVVVPDDDGTPTAFRQAVDVAPYSSARFTSYARPGTADPDFTIRLYDQRGRRRGEVSGASVTKLDPMQPEESLLVALGRPQGVEMIPALPGFNPDPNANPGRTAPQLTIARVDTLGDALPGRWYGFDAAEAIVLDTNDREVMAKLIASGGQAIREWVRRGGHLVVAVGADWSRVRDSFLMLKDDPMLPAVPSGQERVSDLGGLESFAGASKPITPAGGAATSVLVAKLEEVEERGGKVLSASGSVPLVVRGPYGFGRVTVVALDVDQKPFSDWPDRALFWVRALDLRAQGPIDPNAPGMVVAGARGRFYQTGITDLSSLLRRALEQFSEVTLVPFGWVAFFIFLYILLIGPGDYLFLKRVVKRMELTWITFPIIVVTVSLLAYYAAYLVKGKELRVNKVDVVDLDQTTGLARGTVWMNLFSPRNRDYGVGVIPRPLDQDAPAESATSEEGAARPPAGTEVVASWFGVPEPGFGGMGNTSRLSFSGGYAYDPPGTAERLDGVRVPIWSTKCLTARWLAPSGPLVEADLQPVGTDRLSGTIVNRQSVPLKDAVLAFGKQVYELNTIAPGATVRVELSPDRSLSGRLKSKTPSYFSSQPYMAEEFQINRANLALALMFHDSETSIAGSGEPSLASVPLRYLDLTGQLALDRPMLVAQYDRPPTRLALDNAPSAPKVVQTTLLRVILPLKKSSQ